MPAPPRKILKIAVKSIPTSVGIVPKNIPDTKSKIDLVSNVIPGKYFQGVTIRSIPVIPITRPTAILPYFERARSFFSQMISYKMLKDNNIAMF
ncbi:hypothetical protein SDC9_122269 [bioreactor metagenome]|uniref:Uncharacterized protein n=1 Tax=bioreactor metagenome TaxID=1076179 RepID=A0A645CE95_9ZZZZ